MGYSEVREGILHRSGVDGEAATRVLSQNDIETLDLLSEGVVDGLSSGEWQFSGELGEIGWRTSTFVPYIGLAGTTGQEWLRSIYWNEVPVVSSLGKANFQRVDVSYTKGHPNGDEINQNSPELTVSRSISERLRATELDENGNPESEDVDNSKVYRIFNKDCVAAIINVKTPMLAKTLVSGDDAGSVKTTTVEYWIYYRPMFRTLSQGSNSEAAYILTAQERISGKVNYGYVRSTRIDFDENYLERVDFLGWEIKLVRITEDSFQGALRNQTYVDSITEIYSSVFTYPNSAIVRSKFSAEFFQRIPNRSFDMRLLKVNVPTTYNPILKTYTEGEGGWDGTFKEEKEWTDNPAWCYYDLLTNSRYGLGRYLPQATIDKWTLYEVAKYCDTLVADGYGGLEPRFTCNLLLNTREEAYKTVNDMASIFRALTYYGGGTISVVQDSEKVPYIQFTNANVENGDFNYSSSAKKARHTVAIVHYNDPQNFFKPATEYVEDVDGIRRYGIRETDLNAFGCTSRGQALRLGRWALLTETMETETVSFVAGFAEGARLCPGDVFKVFDANRKVARHGGRTRVIENSTNTAKVILDSAITLATGNKYKLSILTPGFMYDPQSEGMTSNDVSGIRNPQLQSFTVTGIQTTGFSGTNTMVQLYEPFNTSDYSIDGNLVWTLELFSGQMEEDAFISTSWDYYRAINIVEKDENKFEVVGLQYAVEKFAQIESGLNFEQSPDVYRVRPQAPSSLELNIFEKTANTKIIDYLFAVDNYTGITSYRVFAKQDPFADNEVPDETYLAASLPVDIQHDTFLPSDTGNYYFRVYSVNDEINGYSTGYASGNVLIEDVNPIRDVIISSLTLAGSGDNDAGYRDSVVYEGEDPMFVWQAGYSADSSVSTDLTYRITVRAPSTTNVPSTTVYYEVTGYNPDNDDLSWEFDFDTNSALASGPYRNYDVVVEGMNSRGETSAGNDVINAIDNQFINNPFGYDILNLYNPIPTGIGLTDFDGDNPYAPYHSTGYMTPNGDIAVLFDSGSFSSDIIGGYIYTSKVTFNSGHAMNGSRNVGGTNYPIHMLEFSVNVNQDFKYCLAPNPYPKVLTQAVFVAISFFDSFDREKKINGNNIYQDLWFSNTIKARAGDLSVAQEEVSPSRSTKSMTINLKTGVNDNYKVVATNSSGQEIILSSYKG